MRVRLQVIIEGENGRVEDTQEVFQLQRGELKPEQLGLTLEESKRILEGIQRTLVTQQMEDYVATQRSCPACGRERRHNGRHEIIYRTLFGRLQRESPRFYQCHCEGGGRKSFSPLAELLPERTAPELQYLEAKWASLIPFQATSELLADILPLGPALGTTSVRRRLHEVAERIESQLGEERFLFCAEGTERNSSLPDPTYPTVVGLDGGYVHSCEQRSRQEGWFEVIVGKSVPAEGPAKRLAFVSQYDTKPKRRLFEVLQAQGVHANQPVTFLSDGGETVRNLPMYLNPLAEHLLDWFHIAMRLTVMGQMNKGMREQEPDSLVQSVEKQLESLDHHLWNGNIRPALGIVDHLQWLLEDVEMGQKRKNLLKAVQDFGNYIRANREYIPNYGDRYRNQEIITTSFVESAVNQVVSRRMVKKQPMVRRDKPVWSRG